MNELGLSLLWLAAQVTLLCCATAMIYLIARRRHPTAGATAALSGLLLCGLLTASAFSPWPRWSLQTAAPAGNETPTGASEPSLPDRPADSGTLPTADRQSDGDAVAGHVAQQPVVESESTSIAAWNAFWRNLGRPQTPAAPTNRPQRWTAWLAGAILLAMALGAIRLLAGWLAVQRCLKRSTHLDEDALTQTLQIHCAELGERRTVALRESNEITSAATIGWRRPVILLPRSWRNWSPDQQRIVLAHELAHVHASDAATWLAAQVGLLLHFYHPLVHWLAHRLRLEQELAADAVAARLTGSPQSYLASLAELAVRQPDHPLAWPARAFLPTRGTLLRRIEMLRDTKSPPLRSSTLRRTSVVALTLAAGVFVAGLRPPESEQALAQDTAKPQAGQASSEDRSTGGFNLEHVPGSTKVLMGLRPAQIAGRPEMAPLVNMINASIKADKTGIRFEDIDQVLYILAGPVIWEQDVKLVPGRVVEVRMKEPTDFAAFAKNRHLTTNDQLTAAQRQAIRQNDGRQLLAAIRDKQMMDVVDERTMRYGLGKDLWALRDDLDRKSVGRPEWAETFEKVADDHACIVGDVAAFRSFLESQFQEQPHPIFGLLVPLWKNTNLAIGSVRFDDKLPITVHAWASDADAAAKLEQALLALVPLGRGMLESGKASLGREPEDRRSMMQQSIALAETALESLNIQTDGDHVTLSVTADGAVAPLTTLVAAFGPSIQTSREAARLTQAKNNIKQLGLAFHNYHDMLGHFPPPVLIGPDGKTEYSWRIEILPLLGRFDLYRQYDRTQPWDSEHNRKVLEQMPDLFRTPNAKTDSKNSAYYVLVGPSTSVGHLPGPGSEVRDVPRGQGFQVVYESTGVERQPGAGISKRDIADGLSNTLLIVEAKRHIPWTKPEDIPYSSDGDLPELGGFWSHADGFHASFADGAVGFIATAIDEATLRNLITRDDGDALPNGTDR